MSKRVKRDEITVSEEEILKPLDITKFGSAEDPCFGKLYNLGTNECKRCGDSEICGVVFSQKMNKDRKVIESTNRFKDLELVQKNPKISEYVEKLVKKGYTEQKIIRLTKKKFTINRKEVKRYING